MPESALTDRINELLAQCQDLGTLTTDWLARGNEILHGTLTILVNVYGPNSPQIKSLQEAHKMALAGSGRGGGDIAYQTRQAIPVLRGALESVLAELEAGLAGDLRKEITGAVITDFIQLARVTLQEGSDGAKNVAAVLAAAAYEDTIRRMGRDLAGVVGRDDLSDVINALKTQGVLKAPQLGIALGYLNFRNFALHANWADIDRSAVNSVLGFVEALLLKHFT
ncbi:MAG TPA: hypothetical protein VL287_08215 [Gemmatimonadales bacterium]|jgi:hypothetical protein|nr:hypothetical protein [Gemmatimonadales bacterium]